MEVDIDSHMSLLHSVPNIALEVNIHKVKINYKEGVIIFSSDEQLK